MLGVGGDLDLPQVLQEGLMGLAVLCGTHRRHRPCPEGALRDRRLMHLDQTSMPGVPGNPRESCGDGLGLAHKELQERPVEVAEETRDAGSRVVAPGNGENFIHLLRVEGGGGATEVSIRFSLAGGATPLPLPGQTGAEIPGKNANYAKVTVFQDAANPATLTIPVVGTGQLLASTRP